MKGAAALLTVAVTVVVAQAPAGPDPSALQDCAAIPTAADRLTCYDRLAGRNKPATPGATARQTPAPVPAAGASAAAPAPGPAPTAPAAPPKAFFGLYSQEHPAPPPVAASLTATVTAMGTSARGHPTVTLEGGQVWELDASDPLLAIGDTVTIRRATLGSFLLETPSRRRHRARRLH